jgi:acetyl esterase/lipase
MEPWSSWTAAARHFLFSDNGVQMVRRLRVMAIVFSISAVMLRAAFPLYAETTPAPAVPTGPTEAPQGLPPVVLWPGGAPGALGTADADIPSLTPFLPVEKDNSGTAVVICPGGAYAGLAPHEGRDYALFLNQHGVAGFVLKYRLGSHGYRHPAMLNDAARALRYVRAHAAEYQVDPKKIGIMGSSAGGHLASTLLTHFDAGDAKSSDAVERQSSRPDFGILCYAVITMGQNTHEASRAFLLGPNPSPEAIRLLSNELQVTDQTPPCFIFHTWKDQAVKVDNSLNFALALREHHVEFDLHIYQDGDHGMGLGDRVYPYKHAHPWTRDLLYWLKARGLIKDIGGR